MQAQSQMHPCSESQTDAVRRVTWTGLLANLLLAAGKAAAGIFGHSQAIVADAVHSLSDSATDIVILVGVRFWNQPPDKNHPHGHQRIETLIVAVIGLALGIVALGIGYRAISTIQQPHAEPPSWIAFGAALASILVKEVLYQWTARVGKRVRSSALLANAWHHRSDSFSSIPAALAILGARIHPAWGFLDHIGAILVALLILQAAWSIAHPAFEKLVDSGAPETIRNQIQEITLATDGVEDTHAIRTRYVGCNSISVDMHVLVCPTLSVRAGHAIATAVKHNLQRNLPELLDVVIHLEPNEASKDSNFVPPQKNNKLSQTDDLHC